MFKVYATRSLEEQWVKSTRWADVKRPYNAEDVVKLRGSIQVEHTLARLGAERFWSLLKSEPQLNIQAAQSSRQAVGLVRHGQKALSLSNKALLKEINNALLSADQNDHMQEENNVHWFAPIVVEMDNDQTDSANTFDTVKRVIDAGAAAVQFGDRVKDAPNAGVHLMGTQAFVQNLVAARLAADVMGVQTVVIAQTYANAVEKSACNFDEGEYHFLTGRALPSNAFRLKNGVECAINRALAYAPYADIISLEASTLDLDEAARFAQAVQAQFPEKQLAYHYDGDEVDEVIQQELIRLGFRCQFEEEADGNGVEDAYAFYTVASADYVGEVQMAVMAGLPMMNGVSMETAVFA